MDTVSADLKANRVDVQKVKLEPLEEMLQEAESAVRILENQIQLNAVTIARARFEELKAMVSKSYQPIKSQNCIGCKLPTMELTFLSVYIKRGV